MKKNYNQTFKSKKDSVILIFILEIYTFKAILDEFKLLQSSINLRFYYD